MNSSIASIDDKLEALLESSAVRHRRLCPRQVLGARMGLFAGSLLELIVPREDKRLLTIVETDGCFADGISVSTGCEVGRRTLRVEDCGKVAATFVDTRSERTIRIAPNRSARTLARRYAPDAQSRWHAQLIGYQKMPLEELLSWQQVRLVTPVPEIIGKPGSRTRCSRCDEEIINQREVLTDWETKCRSCAGQSYYRTCQTGSEILAREPGK